MGVALIWKVPVDIEAKVVETRAVISMGWYLIMGIEIGTAEGEARRGGGVGAGVLDGTGTGIVNERRTEIETDETGMGTGEGVRL